MSRAYHIFDTPIGPCAIAWTKVGIARVLLPEEDPGAMARALEADGWVADAPDATASKAISAIRAHLAGTPHDFADIALDLDGFGPFARAVYERAQRLPSGTVCTYGEMAQALERPGAARAVGQALGRNPVPLLVPCHRIVAAGGKPGGFSAPGGLATKARLLALEAAATAPSLWEPRAVEEAIRHLRRDKRLRTLIDAVGPFALKRRGASVFESLCESIIYQQLAGTAAAAITRRFKALLPDGLSPTALLALDLEALRGAGLSGGKIASLRGLATAAVEGAIDLDRVPRMQDDEIAAHVTRVKGIGPWTVQMLLIFHLGRPDVFPVGDLGIRKAIQRLRALEELPRPDVLADLASAWAPWRTVAAWYLWRSLDTPGWSG